MRVEIDAAREADLPAIGALWNRIIEETTITFTSARKTEAGLRDWLGAQGDAGWPVLVARGPGVLGFASYGAFRGGPGYAHVAEHTVYVGEAARGRGVGAALMDALAAEAASRGIAALVAGISAENAGGLAFHAARGFAEVGRVPGAGRKFGREIDLVLMHRRIDAG
ncbi:N-acetyltransferase family protein [Roseobacter sp. HKCCA0434]|uniref:GNAT family N-acetyltransferase n=1 Tax=Roseobacter sp. HKCCA0434 TaxID=3079297 RepID=UPI002905A9CC|nr:N-acetyltransferase family protein [Roseobacter sp. HKCCA0434]